MRMHWLGLAVAALASCWHCGPPWSRFPSATSRRICRSPTTRKRTSRDDFRSGTHLQAGAADNQGMSAALPAFDYQRLDAFKVARETLRLGDALARRLPRGYATLQDQLRRALLSAYLGIAEASRRQGADRLCRFRCARGEACEAAAALDGVLVLNLAPRQRS